VLLLARLLLLLARHPVSLGSNFIKSCATRATRTRFFLGLCVSVPALAKKSGCKDAGKRARALAPSVGQPRVPLPVVAAAVTVVVPL